MVEPNLVVHRMGGRGSVFPRAAWAVIRGLGADADVVFEVINGIMFLTPLWLRKPRVALVNHPHRALYMGEFGSRLGRLLCAALEELPLRLLYRRVPFLTISDSARQELVGARRGPGAEHHARLLRDRARARSGRASVHPSRACCTSAG